MTVLEVEGLRVRFGSSVVVDDVSLAVEPGECLAIVGESGAGKSLTARALLGLTPDGAVVEAKTLRLDGIDARSLPERRWRGLRGSTVALVAQDALVSLDPLRRIGSEVAEPIRVHELAVGRAERRRRVQDLLERVWMPDAARRARQYPHELSGGLRQRALIASALAAAPAVLVADEPTTALDATVQARILDLLRTIADAGTAVVFVSHDLAAVRRLADRIVVMRAGRIVEAGAAAEILDDPRHEYTRQLLAATRHRPKAVAGDPARPIVTVSHVTKSFGRISAVADASFELARGRTLGVVGESGSGKTTLARMILGVERPDAGDVRWHGDHRVQFVHQNPLGAFDPRWSVSRSLREALQAAGVPRAQRAERAIELLEEVDVDPGLGSRRARQLSGGQRQRAAIARALAADPEVLILDEPVSALDPSVRERVLRLLRRLQIERGLTMIFVSHDLDVVAAVADEVVVMQEGRVVEQGALSAVFAAPQHPFTRELLAAGGIRGMDPPAQA
ncbi:ATP-binding cassette domain-containing protein [Microbacterium sp. NPDC055903]